MAGKNIDFIVGVSLFMIAIIFTTMISLNYLSPSRSEVKTSELKGELFKACELLMESRGEPVNWHTTSNLEKLGLAFYDKNKKEVIEGVLDENKVNKLYSIEYTKAKEALGLKRDINIRFVPKVEDWWNSTFEYRKALLVNSSLNLNVSVNLSFPRAHAHITSVRIRSSSSSIPFEIKNPEYWDSNKYWLKYCTIEFKTNGEKLFYVYYDNSTLSPANTTLNLVLSNVSVEIGEEERFYNFPTYGKTNIANKENAVVHRILNIREAPRIAYINGSEYEFNLTENLGYSLDYYSQTNISDLIDRIFFYDVVVVGSKAGENSAINAYLSNKAIFDYVYLGGCLAVFGQGSNYTWLSNFGIRGWDISGENQTVANFSLRIIRSPNNLAQVYTSNDSIYLSGAPYTSVPKVINRSLYNRIEKITINRTEFNESLIKNGYFDTNANYWSFSSTDPSILGGWEASGNIYVDVSSPDITGMGEWNQTLTYSNTTLLNKANLSFCYNVSAWNSPGASNILRVSLRLPNGKSEEVWSESLTGLTQGWVCISRDISSLVYETGEYNLRLIAELSTGAGTPEIKIQWDNISLNLSYNPAIWISGEIGEGKITITGDEPSSTKHDRLIENVLEWCLPEKNKYVYEMVAEAW